MLSSVSKLVDKAFVVGFLLPALLAVFTALNVLHCPSWFSELCTVKSDDPFGNLTYVALVVWTVAVLLLSLNYYAYRLLEGYLPPVSWLASLKRWHLRRARRWRNERLRLRAMGDHAAGGKIQYRLLTLYPVKESDFLPTLFGNAIRAFEFYPKDLYGVDTISGWERLQAVIPSSYQQMINDAHSQVDFFMNVCLLSLLLALLAAGKLLAEALALQFLSAPAESSTLVTTVVVSVVIAWLAYRCSFGSIFAWGELVKSAFDCYLPALGKQLGYDLPASEAKRKQFWLDVSVLLLYRIEMPDRKWKRATAGSGGAGGKGDSGDGGGKRDSGDDGGEDDSGDDD
jgi:uncharacterized membrane protein YgcG